MARMLRQLVDRPLADAVAENRPGGPRWLTAPVGTGGPACAWFDRIVVLSPLIYPVSASGETFYQDFRAYGPAQHAKVRDAVAVARIAAALDGPPAVENAFLLGGSVNHFHWLADFLPRLALVAGDPALAARAAIVHGAIRDDQRTGAAFVAGALGIPVSVLVPVPDGASLIGDAAVPTRIARETAVGFWRRVLADAGIRGAPRRRLYVRRGAVSYRSVEDEDALADRLARLGIEAVDPARLGLEEQIRTFADAAVIVGAHGAGLANLLFAPAGATLIELRAPFHTGEYQKIAGLLGLRGETVDIAPAGKVLRNPLKRDLRVDRDALVRLEALLSRLA